MNLPVETTLECLVTLKSKVQRLRSHDIEAIAGLMEQYRHRLYRYLMRLVWEPSIADDLFQQTWLRTMEHIQSYDPRRSFEGWLFAIAHNLAIDHLRRLRPESLDEQAFSAETKSDRTRSADPGALDQLLSREKAGLVLRAMADLPVAFREALTLHFEEEMKLKGIADVLGLPIATAKTRVHRALKALRQSMEKKLGAEERP